jgi:iron complex transport system substrate-binding protein
MVGLEAIAPHTDSRLVVIEPTPPGLAEDLASSPFWTYLPPVKKRQIYQIDPVWPFGGVYQVARLAVSLADALIEGGHNNVR